MLPYGGHAFSGTRRGCGRCPRRRCAHLGPHLPARLPHRPRRPRQHRRWPLEHLGRVVGRARADHAIRPASITPTSSIRSATRSPSRKPTSSPAPSARRCGRSPDNPYLTHNVVALISFVLAFAGAYYLVRYLTGSRGGGRRRRRCSTPSARSSSRARRTSSCCSPAAFRSACSPSIAWSIGAAVPRALALGLLLWLQALACAYYGIFAGLMVGPRDPASSPATRRLLAQPRLLDRRSDWRRSCRVGADRAVLPALPATCSRTPASPAPWTMRGMYSADAGRLARLVGVGAPLVAAVDRAVQRGAVPRRRSRWCSAIGRARHRGCGDAGLRASWCCSTACTAVLAFWLSFGPDAGLYTAFFHTIPVFSFLRAPGRIGIVVVLCLVGVRRDCGAAAGCGTAATRGLGRRGGAPGDRRTDAGAADGAPRGGAVPGCLSHAGDPAAGRGGRVSVLLRAQRLPAPRHLHAELDHPLDAARQRLQRPHPAGVPRSGAGAQLVPDARVVSDPRPGRRPLRGLPPEHVRRGARASG